MGATGEISFAYPGSDTSRLFNDGETECIVVERFRDADALIQHGENLAHLMDAIVATGSVSGELLGALSSELRSRFAADGPVQLFTPWARM